VVAQRRQKPEAASRELGEDRATAQQQIEWIHNVMTRTSVAVVNCHDDAWIVAGFTRVCSKKAWIFAFSDTAPAADDRTEGLAPGSP